MELSLQKFLELARQTEAFFLKKRLILSKQKPEQFIKDVSVKKMFWTKKLNFIKDGAK